MRDAVLLLFELSSFSPTFKPASHQRSLAGTQRLNNLSCVCLRRKSVAPQLALSLTVLVTQQMATKGLPVSSLSGGGDLEAFFHTLVGFLLWHDRLEVSGFKPHDSDPNPTVRH